MSESHDEEKDSSEGESKGDREEQAPSDEEDDCEGYFLEPAGNNVDIAERIAEANKKLLEEEDEDENRPRKVQFSEDLVNFLPSNSDDDYTESPRNSVISEEDSELKFIQETTTTEEPPEKPPIEEETIQEDIEDVTEEIIKDSQDNKEEEIDEGNNKILLVLLPKEQNSSCESIIGEEIPEEEKIEKKEETEPTIKPKIARPKSAKKSCEMAKISPNLSYTSNLDRKSWQTYGNITKHKKKGEGDRKKPQFGETRVEIKKRSVKKINIGELNPEEEHKKETIKRCCDNRPRSSHEASRNLSGDRRPKTAPMKRTCCVIKTELPRYNGLRSEYGLSAEQLQERKQKTIEIKQQKMEEKYRERQEQLRRRHENEEIFRKWLLNKTKKSLIKKTVKLTDTLTRSDVYIQSHAVYASNPNVPYSIDYSLGKKLTQKKRETREKKNKTIMIEKLLDKVSPHFKRSFNIYLGVRPQ